MNKDIAVFAILFVVLVLVQVLICSHIALFNVAVPFLFIFFIIRLPLNLNLNILFSLSFLLGFLVDIFTDTPGLNSLCCVLLAAVKRPMFYAYVQRDDKTLSVMPSLTTMGWAAYSKYLLTMTGIFSFLVFATEYFSFASVKDIILMTIASTLLSFLLIIALDSLILTKRERL